MRLIVFVFIVFLGGCTLKSPIKIQGYDIVFKTRQLKFADKAFISYFDSSVKLQIYNAGFVVSEFIVYKDKVCKNFFACQDAKTFNLEHFGQEYKEDFLYQLLQNANHEKIDYKDTYNNIVIKISQEKL